MDLFLHDELIDVSASTRASDGLEKLWILRALEVLGGKRRFVSQYGFEDVSVAAFVGLQDFSSYDSPKAALAAIKVLHTQAEKKWSKAQAPADLKKNVGRLVELLDLSTDDGLILEFLLKLCLKPTLSKGFEYFDLGAQSNNLYLLVAAVLGMPIDSARAALSPQSKLMRTGLLKVDADRNFLHRKIELLNAQFAPRMALPELDFSQLLRGMVDVAEAGHLQLNDYEHIQNKLDILLPYLREVILTGKAGVNVLIYGPSGTGKTQLTRALGLALTVNLFEVASADESGESICGKSRLQAYRVAQNLFPARETLLVFDEVEDVFSQHDLVHSSYAQSHKAWMNRMLEGNALPTLWLCNSIGELDRAFIRRFDIVFELPIPPKKQRARILQECCGDLLGASETERWAELEKLSPAVATRAAEVMRLAQKSLPDEQLHAAFGLLINGTLAAQRYPILRSERSASLPDLYDPAFIQADSDVTALARGLHTAPSARICLYGAPGTGKTAYARWLAEELGKPLLIKRASDLLSMFVGGTEQCIAEAFAQAQADEAILLIDEVDSFLQDRRESKHSWETTQVNEMLTQMEGFEGIFIASTNLLRGLDAASLRRFDLKVQFDYLRPEQSWALLQRQCASLGLPAPHDGLNTRLRLLPCLALGDFALALRRHRFTPFSTAESLVAALEAECALKEVKKAPIGFL